MISVLHMRNIFEKEKMFLVSEPANHANERESDRLKIAIKRFSHSCQFA